MQMDPTQIPAQLGNMLRTPTQIIENTYNLYCNPQGKRRLPNDFVPGPYDVICARGKKAHDSEGNVRFRAMVEQHQEEYANCTCKYEKSKIVSYITNSIRQACAYHQGGFVKNVDGLWYEVGDRAAKEKIGQTFRDLLHTKYSSSTKAKAKARIQKRVEEHQQQEQQDQDEQQEQQQHNKRKSFMKLKIPSLLRSSDKEKKPRPSILGSLTGSITPDKPFSEEAVMDHLRSSVQTVEVPAPENFHLSTSTFQLPTEEEWMKLSTTSSHTPAQRRISALGMSGTRRPSLLAMSITEEDNPVIVDENDIREIVDAYMGGPETATTASGRYGIFSSSTKSNPFSSSVIESGANNNNKRGSMMLSSINSHNNPLLKASTTSSFMDMDLDGLLESMDNMSMLEEM